MATLLVKPQPSVALPMTKLLIGNEWVNSKSGKTFPTLNPATGEEICQIAEADAQDVERLAPLVGRRTRTLAE